jgi:pimeloyl-ACP methyl ester carboxylesterase
MSGSSGQSGLGYSLYVTALRDEAVAYARAGELNIAYQVLGSGSVDLVYVPGLLNLIEATAEEPACERHLERMTAFARVVIFDKRGTGLSDRVSAEEMADEEARLADLRAVMDAVDLPRASLLATADGAIPAIQFAARHPERVEALIVVDGTARWMAAEDYDEGFAHDPTPPLEVWGERWGNETTPLLVETLIPSVADDLRWRRVLGRMRRRAGTPRAAHSYWQTAVVNADVRGALADVQARTLVLHCSGDRIVPIGQGRAIADAVAGARFVELPWYRPRLLVHQCRLRRGRNPGVLDRAAWWRRRSTSAIHRSVHGCGRLYCSCRRAW